MSEIKKTKKSNIKDTNTRVTLSMPTKQVERMDRHADELGISRNAFMQIAIADYMSNREFAHGGMIDSLREVLIDEIFNRLDTQKNISE